MHERLRFQGQLAVPHLEQVYREQYAGNESNIMFRPVEENTIGLSVEMKVPHVIAANEDAKQVFTQVFDRLLRRAAVECIGEAMEVLRKHQG